MEANNDRPLAITVLSAFMGLTALLTALFWVLFFANKIEATETDGRDAPIEPVLIESISISE